MVVGYGVCGPNEPRLKDTLDCFARLCDKVVIAGNNLDDKSRKVIESYGFQVIDDNREWGLHQHHIKQNLVDNYVAPLNPTWCVALDMDEVIDDSLTKEGLEKLPFDAYYLYVANLWNEGWKKKWSFWNIRIWKWNGITKFANRPLHCGLAPEWCYFYGSYSPHILWHSGLKDKDKRDKKIERYLKYDPKAIYKDKSYYDALADNTCDYLNKDKIRSIISEEVESYKQSKKILSPIQKMKYFYVKNPNGIILDVPETNLDETLARDGFVLMGEVVVNRGIEVPVIEAPVVIEEDVPEATECPTIEETPVVKEVPKVKKTRGRKAK